MRKFLSQKQHEEALKDETTHVLSSFPIMVAQMTMLKYKLVLDGKR